MLCSLFPKGINYVFTTLFVIIVLCTKLSKLMIFKDDTPPYPLLLEGEILRNICIFSSSQSKKSGLGVCLLSNWYIIDLSNVLCIIFCHFRNVFWQVNREIDSIESQENLFWISSKVNIIVAKLPKVHTNESAYSQLPKAHSRWKLANFWLKKNRFPIPPGIQIFW